MFSVRRWRESRDHTGNVNTSDTRQSHRSKRRISLITHSRLELSVDGDLWDGEWRAEAAAGLEMCAGLIARGS